MNKKHFQQAAYALLSSCVLFACGLGNKKNTIQTKDGEVTVSNLQEAGEKMQESINDAEKRKEERRKKGDTLAINYKDLQKYLPDVDGYTKKGDASGESVSMPGLGSWSTAKQEYENADKEIEIELIDYNQSNMGYTTAAMAFGMNIQIENDREKSGTFETSISGVKGYEKISKQDKDAEVIYAIADRFILNMRLRGSNDAEQLKSIAKKMNLSELASK